MASISKRQQARNERELQDLLRVPGNNQCADCGAPNASWASWNLGIFLCMRCASLHRKMGTHISKVKSLSMDTWSSDQVENMKRNGNTAVNKVYNPKNKQPDIPLDADEVDGAMERFIRKKYQERSLESGRPVPPARSEISPVVPPKSPSYEPAATVVPAQPSKKSRFFGFGLRASSSSLPRSKHDKKKLPPEPRVDSAWQVSGDDYDSLSRSSAPISDAELQLKLTQLKDMGFPNREINTKMLRRMNGDVERTVEALVQLGPQPAERTSSVNKVTSQATGSSRTNVTTAGGSDSNQSAMRTTHTGASNNPFDQASGAQPGFGLSMTKAQAPPPQQSFGSNNPFDIPARSKTDGGLVQGFQNLQVSQAPPQALFPHSTGGYSNQQFIPAQSRMQTMTPPVPQQYGYTASPASLPTNSNPFFQQQQPQPALQSQNTGTNPFMMQQQPQPNFYQMPQAPYQQQPNPYASQQPQSPSTNPFLAQSAPQSPSVQAAGYNPFGIPPPQPQMTQAQQHQQQQMPVDTGSQIGVPGLFGGNNPFQQQQSQAQPQADSPFQDYSYVQPPSWPQQQQAQNKPYSNVPQAQSTTLAPQQTGRYDKNSIMALYNYPALAPAKAQQLSSIPEPSEQEHGQQAMMPGEQMAPRRSATMPVAMGNMHSAGGAGNMGGANRNPFLQNAAAASANPGIMSHSSRDSMVINNLESGRHSPDAFASLSARYV